MNTDDLPAGRELDALVAEKVMGWRITAWNDGEPWGNREVFPPFEPINGIPADCDCISHSEAGEPPHYSTDIAAAWEVVEKLWDEDFHVQFQLVHQVTAGKWRVEFPTRKVPHHNYVFAHADTASLAICRAALKAVA